MEVKEALLAVMRDQSAPGSAKASAARTLAEFYFAEEDNAVEHQPVGALSVDDIDAEIARLTQR